MKSRVGESSVECRGRETGPVETHSMRLSSRESRVESRESKNRGKYRLEADDAGHRLGAQKQPKSSESYAPRTSHRALRTHGEAVHR